MKKSICICGGGQIGTVLAGVTGSKGYDIHIYTGHPESWSQTVSAILPDGKIASSSVFATNRADAAVKNADIVLLCLPGYMIEKTLSEIAPFISPHTTVGSIVCSTGFFSAASLLLPASTSLFGFQRVPFISVMEHYGHSAHLTGYKQLLKMAFLNMEDTVKEALKSMFEQITDTPITEIGYLEASLTNSNPLLHPSRCYSLFYKWDNKPFVRKPLFYEEWDDFSSEIYIECDRELQELLSLLPINRKEIPPVLEYYESTDCHSLTLKIRSIEAFRGIPAPMKATEAGFVPDFSHRFFTEDFPYGMQLIKNMAMQYSVATPIIDRVLDWGRKKQ